MSLGGQLVAKLSRSNENLYSPENGRNNNEFKKKTVQINRKVTQIMTPTVNVNGHTTYANLLHILHNRSVIFTYKFINSFA